MKPAGETYCRTFRVAVLQEGHGWPQREDSEVVNHLYDSCPVWSNVHAFDAPNGSLIWAGARWDDSGRNSGGRFRFFHILSGKGKVYVRQA